MKLAVLIPLLLFIMTDSTYSQSSEKTYILIHGAWHGAWCWKKIIPLLEARGYRVLAPDLPSHGNDSTIATSVTLDDYVKKVAEVANAQNGKVILLGHSMGGAVIAQAAELLGPAKVSKLVFLDAFLLRNGESIFSQVEKMSDPARTSYDTSRKYRARDYLIFSPDRKAVLTNPETAGYFFCDDCPPEDKTFAKAHLCWQSVACLSTPINVTDGRYGVIPKFYIFCTQSKDLDRRSILQNMPCEKIYELPSSHSPFFSMPEKLVVVMDDIYKF